MMRVRVLWFGMFRDKTGKNAEERNASDVQSLVRQLEEEYPFLKGSRYRVAVNQELISGEAPLRDGDEVALMPPFAGG